jgi:hypothetical protein
MQHTGARFAQEISTSKPQGIRLGASWIASESPEVQAEFLSSLTKEEARALPYLFEFWALEHQLPPEGDWRTWLIMGGRTTRARRIRAIGKTFAQAREDLHYLA